VIAQRTVVIYHPGHVWRLLRYMRWSRQRPARRAKERDEVAVEHWGKTTHLAALKLDAAGSSPASRSKSPFRFDCLLFRKVPRLRPSPKCPDTRDIDWRGTRPEQVARRKGPVPSSRMLSRWGDVLERLGRA
jgi:hypothetical protein